MKILERKLQNSTILKLIRTGLKAKVFQKDNMIYTPELGTSQVGILSTPQVEILSIQSYYINLDESGKYMEELSDQYQGHVKAGNRKNNPLTLQLLRSGQSYLYLRISYKIYNKVNYRNLKYLRYHDDFFFVY